MLWRASFVCFFVFFNDTATTEIYPLSLHDALPICRRPGEQLADAQQRALADDADLVLDRKSTRLNSSHGYISYAVFCLKKKHIDERLSTAAVRECRPGGGAGVENSG